MTTEDAAIKKPDLPHEIWLNTFEWATFVPNAFDTHAPDLFAYPGPWSQDQIQLGIRKSLCTKRRIVLVCKAWNALATRLLYQAVPIFRQRTLERILESLRASDEQTHDDALDGLSAEQSKAHWTTRLDIMLKRESALALDGFVELLRRLPNLRIIVVRAPFHTFVRSGQSLETLFDALMIQPVQSLNVLDFSASNHPHSIDKLDALDGLPLHVLRIRPPTLSLWLEKRMTLPDLEFLDAPPQLLRPVLTGEISADTLSYLCLDDDYDAMWKVAKGRLIGTGDRLTALEIDDGSFRPVTVFSHLSMPKIDTLMHRVTESCPRLHSLIINVKSNGSLSHIDYLPSVKKLGLRFHIRDANSKKWFKQLCDVLTRLILLTPSLEVIRVLGKPTLAELQNHHAGSLKVVRKLSRNFLLEHGVRFEDCTGRLFHDDQTTPGTETVDLIGRTDNGNL